MSSALETLPRVGPRDRFDCPPRPGGWSRRKYGRFVESLPRDQPKNARDQEEDARDEQPGTTRGGREIAGLDHAPTEDEGRHEPVLRRPELERIAGKRRLPAEREEVVR